MKTNRIVINKGRQEQETKVTNVKLAVYTLATIAVIGFVVNASYQMLATQGFNGTTALATALSIIIVGVVMWAYIQKINQ